MNSPGGTGFEWLSGCYLLKVPGVFRQAHSVTHRRAVPGRKEDFDVLLAEHKGLAKEKEAEQKRETESSQLAPSAPLLNTPPSSTLSCRNGKTTHTFKLRLAGAQAHRYDPGGMGVGWGQEWFWTDEPQQITAIRDFCP